MFISKATTQHIVNHYSSLGKDETPGIVALLIKSTELYGKELVYNLLRSFVEKDIQIESMISVIRMRLWIDWFWKHEGSVSTTDDTIQSERYEPVENMACWKGHIHCPWYTRRKNETGKFTEGETPSWIQKTHGYVRLQYETSRELAKKVHCLPNFREVEQSQFQKGQVLSSITDYIMSQALEKIHEVCIYFNDSY